VGTLAQAPSREKMKSEQTFILNAVVDARPLARTEGKSHSIALIGKHWAFGGRHDQFAEISPIASIFDLSLARTWKIKLLSLAAVPEE